MAVKGLKSQRDQGEIYQEIKQQSSIALTKTGLKLLDSLAASFKLSRSEFIERIARNILLVFEVNSKDLVTLELIAKSKDINLSKAVEQAIQLYNKTQNENANKSS
jgi:metal-responsive CopG/Arc/MetJ family transcriptional regulator